MMNAPQSPELAEADERLRFFLPEARPLSAKSTAGNINKTWILRLADAPFERAVLQRINPKVFPDVAAVMANFRAVTAHLDAARRRFPDAPEFPLAHAAPDGRDCLLDEDGGSRKATSEEEEIKEGSGLILDYVPPLAGEIAEFTSHWMLNENIDVSKATYVWEQSSDGGATWQTIEGESGSSLRIPTTPIDESAEPTGGTEDMPATIIYIRVRAMVPGHEPFESNWCPLTVRMGDGETPPPDKVKEIEVLLNDPRKKANTMKASAKTIKVKRNKLRRGNVVIPASKAFKVSKAKGSVSFKSVKYLKRALKYKSKIVVKRNGKVVLKKNLKSGTYKIKVKVTAAGNKRFKAKSKIVVLKLRVL